MSRSRYNTVYARAGQTRKKSAEDLMERVQRGPASLQDPKRCGPDDYRLWVQTWVIPYLEDLIPELRKF